MKSILIALLAFAPAFAFAGTQVETQIAKIDAATTKCLDNPNNYSTYGMNACLSEGYDAADRVLNKVYGKIVRDLKKPTGDVDADGWNTEVLSRLIKAQRAWIAFRDTQSSLAGIEMLGGTGESQLVIGTRFEMTKKRALELEALF